jgi:DNA-binding NarL/FixJ family response regulator
VHVLPTAAHPPDVPLTGPDPQVRPQAPEHGAPLRVHVVGADPLARVGIRTLLDGHPGIRVTGESGPGPAAVAVLRAQRPHVVVVHGPLAADLSRPLSARPGDGTRVLTMGGPPPAPGAAHGHLPGTASAGQLASAVVLAAAGYTLVHESARPAPRTAAAVSPASQVSEVSPDQLTERECEVLELLARGMSNGEIAALLTLSEHTVKTHVQNLLHKLRLRNRVHAAIYAFENGLRGPC